MPKSIRTHLLHILWLGVLPMGVFAAVLLYLLWSSQEQARHTNQLKAAQSLAQLIESSVDKAISRLVVFAALPMDTEPERRELYATASEALKTIAEIDNVILSTAQGKQLFNLAQPYGTALPDASSLDFHAAAIQTGQPSVSDVFYSKVTDSRVVGVAVPVFRNGRVAYVLSARLNTRTLGTIVRGRSVPEGGRVAVWDRNLVALAATREENVRTQAAPSPEFLDGMRQHDEGLMTYPAPDGEKATTAWAKTSFGWRVSLRLPADAGKTVIARYLGVLALAWLVVLGFGARFALRKARLVSASLQRLERQAQSLDDGAPGTQDGSSRVAEIDAAASALARARAQLLAARTEREAAFEKERLAREQAEETSRAKDAFLAMLGHELRNPMAAIASASSVLDSARASAEQREVAREVIARQSQVLKRLVDDLLDVGRVMTGKFELHREPVRLDEIVRRVCDGMRSVGRYSAHSVGVDVSPATILADPVRIEQIVVNLLNNALTYTPAGTRIEAKVRAEGESAVLAIADTGPGIRGADRERIFELFYQGEQPPNRPNSGLGIGLTLVKRLAQMHGGNVAAADNPGGGTVFTVTFPLADARSAAPERAPRASIGALDVLVVEDNADARESLRVLLQLAGHRPTAVEDAAQAARAIEHASPDVLLIDIGLPEVDGYELCARLKPRLPHAIFVALSGYGLESDVARAHAAGFHAHLTKPARLEDVEAAIERVRAAA